MTPEPPPLHQLSLQPLIVARKQNSISESKGDSESETEEDFEMLLQEIDGDQKVKISESKLTFLDFLKPVKSSEHAMDSLNSEQAKLLKQLSLVSKTSMSLNYVAFVRS